MGKKKEQQQSSLCSTSIIGNLGHLKEFTNYSSQNNQNQIPQSNGGPSQLKDPEVDVIECILKSMVLPVNYEFS